MMGLIPKLSAPRLLPKALFAAAAPKAFPVVAGAPKVTAAPGVAGAPKAGAAPVVAAGAPKAPGVAGLGFMCPGMGCVAAKPAKEVDGVVAGLIAKSSAAVVEELPVVAGRPKVAPVGLFNVEDIPCPKVTAPVAPGVAAGLAPKAVLVKPKPPVVGAPAVVGWPKVVRVVVVAPKEVAPT